jgi:hypothetical protein
VVKVRGIARHRRIVLRDTILAMHPARYKGVAAGKAKVQAIGACLRKLVMICYGVLKTRAPFDPNWA